MNIPFTTISLGILLIAMSAAGFWISGAPTALIPAGFGILFIVCGVLARNPARLKHAMHAAATLGLVGFVMTAKALLKFPFLVMGRQVDRPLSVMMQSIMSVACFVFILVCVKSFRDVRRAKKS